MVLTFLFTCRSETQALRNINRLRAAWEELSNNGRLIFVLSTMIALSLTVKHFHVASLFVAITLFEKLRQCILGFMLYGVRVVIDTKVSMYRFKVNLRTISKPFYSIDACLLHRHSVDPDRPAHLC